MKLKTIPSCYKSKITGHYIDISNIQDINKFIKDEKIPLISKNCFPVMRNMQDVRIVKNREKITKTLKRLTDDSLVYGYCAVLAY